MVVGIIIFILMFLSILATAIYWMEAMYEEIIEIKKYLKDDKENKDELSKGQDGTDPSLW